MGPSSITSSVKRSAITLGFAAMLQLLVPTAVSGQEAGLTDTRKSPFALLAPVGNGTDGTTYDQSSIQQVHQA